MTVSTLPPRTLEELAAIPALRLVQSSATTRRLAKFIAFCFLVLPFVLCLVPWMQTVSGKGRVVANSPVERQQKLTAPFDGFVVDYYGHRENSYVRKGEPIFRMVDPDPLKVVRVNQQVDAYKQKIEFAQAKVRSYSDQIGLFEFARDMTMQAAQFGIQMAENKISGAEQNLRAAEADYITQRSIHDRTERLYKDPLQLASKQEWEVAEYKMKKAKADLEKAKADLEGAQNDLKSKKAELEQKRNEANAKVAESRAKKEEASGDLATAQKDLRDIESKSAELGRFTVVAPMDGRILRIERALNTDLVKKGDPVLVIVPDSGEPAVELWIDGNDAPLVAGGKTARENEGETLKVRLQFEGWPAVQFTGWPSVAIGTFGGIVAQIDSHDDGEGKFRILVAPDPDNRDPWPGPEYLRQGIQANGWVLLNQVPLGWEFWRRLNGFPPVVSKSKSPDEKDGDTLKTKKRKK